MFCETRKRFALPGGESPAGERVGPAGNIGDTRSLVSCTAVYHPPSLALNLNWRFSESVTIPNSAFARWFANTFVVRNGLQKVPDQFSLISPCCKRVARRFPAVLYPVPFLTLPSFALPRSGKSLYRRLRSLPRGTRQPGGRIFLHLRHPARWQ